MSLESLAFIGFLCWFLLCFLSYHARKIFKARPIVVFAILQPSNHHKTIIKQSSLISSTSFNNFIVTSTDCCLSWQKTRIFNYARSFSFSFIIFIEVRLQKARREDFNAIRIRTLQMNT